MIRTPPQHNTDNPPGQVKPRGLYLRDVIRRIQGEEDMKPQYAEKDPEETQLGGRLPSPVPDSIVGLEALVGALLRACGEVEHSTRLAGTHPSIRTEVIRRIIKENT